MPFVPVSIGPSMGLPQVEPLSGNPAAGIPASPANPDTVLWDQPLSAVNQGAYVDQEFGDFPPTAVSWRMTS
jgi:hypothetical protein